MSKFANRDRKSFKAFSVIAIEANEVKEAIENSGVKANLRLFIDRAAYIKQLEDSEHSAEFIAAGVNSVEAKQNARVFLRQAIQQLAEEQKPELADSILALRKLDGDLGSSIEQSRERAGLLEKSVEK